MPEYSLQPLAMQNFRKIKKKKNVIIEHDSCISFFGSFSFIQNQSKIHSTKVKMNLFNSNVCVCCGIPGLLLDPPLGTYQMKLMD